MRKEASPRNDFEITILLTCYNESEFICNTLAKVTESLQKSVKTFEMIVIDDMSIDDSVEKIKEYIQCNQGISIRLHVNSQNQGVGSNFLDGAFMGKGKYYRVIDGDCPESLEALVKIFKQIGKADIVIPFPDVNAPLSNRTFKRRMISRFYNYLINLLSGYHISYHNGSPIFKRYHVMRWPPFTTGLSYQADLVTRLLDEGFSYIQVPTSGSFEKKGEASSALRMANYLSAAHTLIEISLRRIKNTVWQLVYPNRKQPLAKEIRFEEE